MVLFIDACARQQSRTRTLADTVLPKLPDTIETVNLFRQELRPLDGETLSKREAFVCRADYSDEMFRFAKQFRDAEEIVIAAPYWDLSFPAILKCYLEAVCVNGLTFRYNEQGIPEGLCKAKRLIYVTTAGGFIPDHNFGYDYVKQLCADFFGLDNTVYIKAEGLDVCGADVQAVLQAAKTAVHEKIGGSCR